jgi:hypothetical protein
MSAPTYVSDTGSCEVALPYLGEGVQPCALELGQHEKNGRPVEADCDAIEGGRRAVVDASRVEVPLRNGATSTSRARCWSKKESVHIPRSVVSIPHESKTARCAALFRSTSIVSWNTLARQ